MQLGVNGNKNHSSFFLSTHLSFCRARIYNTHLGYYSLLFTHFTFCFQASPCFSPQSPLNKHKSALSWFPPFPPIRLAGVWSGGRGRDTDFSVSPNSTLNEIKTYNKIFAYAHSGRPEASLVEVRPMMYSCFMLWWKTKNLYSRSVLSFHLSPARSVWLTWGACLALVGYEWMFAQLIKI